MRSGVVVDCSSAASEFIAGNTPHSPSTGAHSGGLHSERYGGAHRDPICELSAAGDHGNAFIFTLNYDLLIERMLIDDNVLGLRYQTTDFFSGLPERSEILPLGAAGAGIAGRLFYPADPPIRSIHLHHLHGCLTHFRDTRTGDIYKISAADTRDHDVFGRLAAAEASPFAPSVILGSRKIEKSQDWPFSHAFLSLEQAARAATTIVIAGYSFRDLVVNKCLRNLTTPEKRWIIIDHRETDEAAQDFKDTVHNVIGDVEVEFVLTGFESPLPEVT